MLSCTHLVCGEPDGVLEAFRFQKLINLGRGEGGVTTEINAGVSCSGIERSAAA